MAEWFATGRVIDVILALVVLEAAVLLVIWHRSRRGVPAREVLVNLASGAALMLAVRAALVDAPWTLVSLWLMLAFAAHAADVMCRWRPRNEDRDVARR